MKKKNYSVIVAFALIALLIVATICIGCSKKEGNNDIQTNNSGDNMNYSNEGLPVIEDYPDLEKNTRIDEDGNKVNISDEINQEKLSFDFLELTNISLKYVDKLTEFRANVVNNSDTNYPQGITLEISFLDDNGAVIYKSEMLTSSIDAHGESNVQGRVTRDFSYAKSIEVKVVE